MHCISYSIAFFGINEWRSDSFIFPAAAIYLAIKEKEPDMAYEVMKKVMSERSDKVGYSLARCCRIPGFRAFFLCMWDAMSHKIECSAGARPETDKKLCTAA